MKIRSAIIVLELLIWVGIVVCGQPALAEDLTALKSGVVKITTKTGQVGTGFIVRVEPQMVYILTAAHVIAGGDLQPEVTFYVPNPVVGGSAAVTGKVLPGAQVNDDQRGLAVVIIRGLDQRPANIVGLPFASSAQLVSGGESALVIGHPRGGGDWAVVKRDISNRIVHDITLDPGVASGSSGGPILVSGKVVGMAMTNRGEFGLGITHKSLLNYLEGIGIEPKVTIESGKGNGIPEEDIPPTSNTGKDGAPMVLVAAGEFTMGARNDDKEAQNDERPAHQVYLDAYYIDQYEVTVERYHRFITQKNLSNPTYWDQVDLQRDARKPVVGVNWLDAYDYCEWAGKRLPTEAEWEKAARGTDTRTFPWGEARPNSSTANFGKDGKAGMNVYAERLKDVGTYESGKSPYGAYDMAGNVWEWVNDWYEEAYYQHSPNRNPRGPENGKYKVLRGGSWSNFDTGLLRTAFRDWYVPSYWIGINGFRCAQGAP